MTIKQIQSCWLEEAEERGSHLVVAEEPDSLHLVERRVVTGVDLVPPVNVSDHQEGVQAGAHQLPLVGGGVGAEHRFPAHRHVSIGSDATGEARNSGWVTHLLT